MSIYQNNFRQLKLYLTRLVLEKGLHWTEAMYPPMKPYICRQGDTNVHIDVKRQNKNTNL